MMKKFIYGVLSFAPALTFAAATLSGLDDLVKAFGSVLARVIPIMFALAIIYFFWGLIEYIRAAGDPKKAAEGRSIMIWGVIAIAIMVSIYGLVQWLQTAIGINNTTNIGLPSVPFIT